MAIVSVSNWLSNPNRDYHVGRVLFEQYGDNKVLQTLFNSGSSNYHFQKLISALEAVNIKPNVEPKQIVIPEVIAAVEAVKTEHGKIDLWDAPEQIRAVRDEKNVLYAQARKLHESIRLMDRKADRLEAGLLILDLMDRVAEAWQILDNYRESGAVRKLSEKTIKVEVDALEIQALLKEKACLAPNISRDKKRLLEAKTDKQRIKIQTRLDIRILRLKKINERIGLL